MSDDNERLTHPTYDDLALAMRQSFENNDRSRRDMFAAHALQGLIDGSDGVARREDMVNRAWELADLMIKRCPGA